MVALAGCARHPSDDLVGEGELGVVLRNLGAVDLEHAQRAIHAAAVVLARDRLLAGVAALLEVDRRPVEARLRRQDAIVELATEARSPGSYAKALELLVAYLAPRRRLLVQHLVGRDAVLAVRDPAGGVSRPTTSTEA